MGKNDFTPKGIANASKAKGLQKLRFWCQVCSKQCRDENGFKCHQTSEAHLRQMAIFGQNQGKFIAGYSADFQRDFLALMAVSHRNSRVAANVVYNEYIANKTHVHMNSTKWTTLTEFIKHLGREKICVVDETPKGWFITYAPEDKEEQMRQASLKKRERATEEEEERNARHIREQIERATREGTGAEAAAATELRRADGDAAVVKIGLGLSAADAHKRQKLAATTPSAFDDGAATATGGERKKPDASLAKKKPPSALDEIMRADAEAKARRARANNHRPESESQSQSQSAAAAAPVASSQTVPWLMRGIVVKILSPALRGESGLYRKKARVRDVTDGGFVADLVALDDAGHRARVDQAELETVLPAVGGAVLVLRGRHRGREATLLGLETEKFKARVRVEGLGGGAGGEVLELDYEDVSKAHRQT